MSPGVNGSSLMPREMAGKAAASALNVAARRLVRHSRPELGPHELAATGRSVLGDSCRGGDAGGTCGTSQGAGPGGRDRARNPGGGSGGKAEWPACGWTAAFIT